MGCHRNVNWVDLEVSGQKWGVPLVGMCVRGSQHWLEEGWTISPFQFCVSLNLPPWLTVEAVQLLCSFLPYVAPFLPYQTLISPYLPPQLNYLQWSMIDTHTTLKLEIPPSGKYETIHIFLEDFPWSKLVMKWLSNAITILRWGFCLSP